MYDAKDLLKIIKQAAMEAVAASNPVAVCMGTVTDVSPLKIKTGQKLVLSEAHVVKCRETGKLKEQDNVVMLRQQGGQKYIILGVF